MKILIRFSILAAVFITALAYEAEAQVDATVTAEVTDFNFATVIKINDVDFGQIATSSSPVIDPADPSASTDVLLGSIIVGEFRVEQGTETDLIVNYSTTALEGPGTDIIYTPHLVGNVADNQGSSTTLNDGTSITTDPDGFYYLWLGGDLGTIPPAQDTGHYDAIFTLSITFAN